MTQRRKTPHALLLPLVICVHLLLVVSNVEATTDTRSKKPVTTDTRSKKPPKVVSNSSNILWDGSFKLSIRGVAFQRSVYLDTRSPLRLLFVLSMIWLTFSVYFWQGIFAFARPGQKRYRDFLWLFAWIATGAISTFYSYEILALYVNDRYTRFISTQLWFSSVQLLQTLFGFSFLVFFSRIVPVEEGAQLELPSSSHHEPSEVTTNAQPVSVFDPQQWPHMFIRPRFATLFTAISGWKTVYLVFFEMTCPGTNWVRNSFFLMSDVFYWIIIGMVLRQTNSSVDKFQSNIRRKILLKRVFADFAVVVVIFLIFINPFEPCRERWHQFLDGPFPLSRIFFP